MKNAFDATANRLESKLQFIQLKITVAECVYTRDASGVEATRTAQQTKRCAINKNVCFFLYVSFARVLVC